jgi:DNA-binding winged helix-turn-helix (wHTH) protein/tetratricopeptide (TPR) repeat protein
MSHPATASAALNSPSTTAAAGHDAGVRVLRIGRCELRPQSREILRDGRPQPVRPLVFDLLMALVQQRPRALSRSELMTAVWGRTVVTDSALTRTVMEARRAIGDSASAPACIATVHSHGYRFDGHVDVLEQPAAAMPAALPPGPAACVPAALDTGRLRVGLMPCRNETRDAALDWAPLGLMALVEHALDDNAIAWVSATTMAAALARPEGEMLADERAAMAMAAMQLDRVVVPVLRRQQRALWLDFQVFARGQGGAVGHGSVRETEPVALARRFAQALSPHLLAQRSAELPFFSSDGFVNQAYARAVELASHNDYSAARPLLDTVCQLEPENRTGALARLRVAVRMRDLQAAALGADLLAACVAAGDTVLPARVHALLWEAVLNAATPADSAVAEHHRQTAGALAAARGEEDQDWFLAFLSQQGVRAMQAGRAAEARQLMDAAAEACRRAGNRFRLAVLAQNRIGLDLQAGDLLIARQRLDEAAAYHQQVRQQPVGQLHVWTMSAYVNAGLGMLDAASAQASQMLAQLGQVQHPGPACAYPFWAAQGFLDTGDARGLATALQACAALPPETHPAVQFGRWAIEGCLRMCQGDVTAAGTLLGRALEVAPAAGGVPFMHECAKLLLRLDSAIGDPDHLGALCERVQALPGLADCLPLQWALAHAHASELLLRGDRAGALQQLSELIASSATGRENACARLDAAWLCCEQGDLARASRLLAGAGRWRHEHPAGLATEARLLMSARRFEAAARLLRAAIERHQGLAPHWHHELLRCCEQPQAGQGRAQWRQLPRLASASWQRGIVSAPTRRLQPRAQVHAVSDRRRLAMPALLPLAALATPPFRSSAPPRP